VTDFAGLLEALVKGKVDFVLVGGAAATAHGSARLTLDIDIVHARNPANLRKIVAALGPLHPYLRGAPAGLPFVWDERTLAAGVNFTLTTALGSLDLLGEIAGGGTYESLAKESSRIRVAGVECLCLDLVPLIRVKRAAGRPKDLEAIAELEALRDEKASGEPRLP
jgi:hypothetical protein